MTEGPHTHPHVGPDPRLKHAPWLRVVPSIRQLILGEVERQYHPIGTQEFKERVEWMTDAWMWAMESNAERPTIDDILFVAGRIEPVANKLGFRTQHVSVGGRNCPDPERVPELVSRLWTHIHTVLPRQGRAVVHSSYMTADDFYLEFENIHPFVDGNGRTGKVLHNWLLGTLHNPVLVKDYFGGGNH